MQPKIQIRKGRAEDLPALLSIYNYEVENGIATFDLHPKTTEDWNAWFQAHSTELHPLLVAEMISSGSMPCIAGYATLSPYRAKEAYHSTVELSVYVSPTCRGQGVASALLEAILQLAHQNADIHVVVSVITSGNEASTHLHEKFGFTYCGTLHEVGYKHGAYRDIDHYELFV